MYVFMLYYTLALMQANKTLAHRQCNPVFKTVNIVSDSGIHVFCTGAVFASAP